ncbi:hypothetical protein BJY52DRAFT_1355371 [Lactarius psammicola]|nr:hypothetical protein BJY52DRAFT_1355371 [Lactarius psammicola]
MIVSGTLKTPSFPETQSHSIVGTVSVTSIPMVMRYHRPFSGLATPLAPWDDICAKLARNAVPSGWENLGYSPTVTVIDLRVALRHHHMEHTRRGRKSQKLALRLDRLELSNCCPRRALLCRFNDRRQLVDGHQYTRAKDLLNASYQQYWHAATNGTVLRTVRYWLTAVLHAHARTVTPTTYFISMRILRQKPRKMSVGAPVVASGELKMIPSKCIDVITPESLYWLYNREEYVPARTNQNVLGVVGYFDDYPSQENLTTFMTKYRSDGADAPVVNINGQREQPGRTHRRNKPRHPAC